MQNKLADLKSILDESNLYHTWVCFWYALKKDAIS